MSTPFHKVSLARPLDEYDSIEMPTKSKIRESFLSMRQKKNYTTRKARKMYAKDLLRQYKLDEEEDEEEEEEEEN